MGNPMDWEIREMAKLMRAEQQNPTVPERVSDPVSGTGGQKDSMPFWQAALFFAALFLGLYGMFWLVG